MTWMNTYTEDELAIIRACEHHKKHPSRLPGSGIMLLVAKLAADLDAISGVAKDESDPSFDSLTLTMEHDGHRWKGSVDTHDDRGFTFSSPEESAASLLEWLAEKVRNKST